MKPLRLLIVEDHLDSAELLAELLVNRGHTVRIALTASEALAIANEQTFDVVVSDVGLPDSTGYELMAKLRERSPIKGIAMTGSGAAADIARGREAGFAMHLTKPVSLSRLEQALEALAG